jgi:hypothetical protein
MERKELVQWLRENLKLTISNRRIRGLGNEITVKIEIYDDETKTYVRIDEDSCDV